MRDDPVDTADLAALERLATSWQKEGLFTHFYASAGNLSERDPQVEISVGPDSRDVFDLASLTKALFTTPAILLKAAELSIQLDQPLSVSREKFPEAFDAAGLLPELWNFSLRALLRHEGGLPAWRNFYVQEATAAGTLKRRSPREAMATILQEPRLAGPKYSDVGFIALGMILEELYRSNIINVCDSFWEYDKRLSTVFQQLKFAPKWDPEELARRAVPTGYCAVRGQNLSGSVYDENAWSMGGCAAHAGLFGSGRDLSSYLCAMYRSPIGRRVLDLQAREIKHEGNTALLGWRQGADDSANSFGGGYNMGHLGFTGTAFWITPPFHPTKPNRYGIVLTNRTIHGRINPKIKELRRKCFELLWKII